MRTRGPGCSGLPATAAAHQSMTVGGYCFVWTTTAVWAAAGGARRRPPAEHRESAMLPVRVHESRELLRLIDQAVAGGGAGCNTPWPAASHPRLLLQAFAACALLVDALLPFHSSPLAPHTSSLTFLMEDRATTPHTHGILLASSPQHPMRPAALYRRAAVRRARVHLHALSCPHGACCRSGFDVTTQGRCPSGQFRHRGQQRDPRPGGIWGH
jgi:hypothetical protein